MAEPRVHPARVALRVSDVQRSADFYRASAVFGSRGGRRSGALAAPDDRPVLLGVRRAERPGPAPRRATALPHASATHTRQLGATLRGLVRQRAPLTGASDHLVSEALYLDDPDGLASSSTGTGPAEEWPAPQPGFKVAMDTLPLDLESVLVEPEPDGDPAAGNGRRARVT